MFKIKFDYPIQVLTFGSVGRDFICFFKIIFKQTRNIKNFLFDQTKQSLVENANIFVGSGPIRWVIGNKLIFKCGPTFKLYLIIILTETFDNFHNNCY